MLVEYKPKKKKKIAFFSRWTFFPEKKIKQQQQNTTYLVVSVVKPAADYKPASHPRRTPSDSSVPQGGTCLTCTAAQVVGFGSLMG